MEKVATGTLQLLVNTEMTHGSPEKTSSVLIGGKTYNSFSSEPGTYTLSNCKREKDEYRTRVYGQKKGFTVKREYS